MNENKWSIVYNNRRKRHRQEAEQKPEEKALIEFRRKPYEQSIDILEYLQRGRKR